MAVHIANFAVVLVSLKEGTVPGLQAQGGFLREQEGLCTLQKQPRENTTSLHHRGDSIQRSS